MRLLLVAAALLAATPAVAADYDQDPVYQAEDDAAPPQAYGVPDEADRPYQVERHPSAARDRSLDGVPRPEQIKRAGVKMHRVLDALLAIDVAPLADAVQPERPHAGRHVTVGDLARRDDPAFDARAHRSIDAVTRNGARMTGTMAHLAPALRQELRRIERDFDQALREPVEDDDGN